MYILNGTPECPRLSNNETYIHHNEIVSVTQDLSLEAVKRAQNSRRVVLLAVKTGALPTAKIARDVFAKERPDATYDTIKVKTMEGMSSTGILEIIEAPKKPEQLKGALVVVKDDILDTALTYNGLRDVLKETYGAQDVLGSFLLRKYGTQLQEVDEENTISGILIADEFVVGWGLDFNGLYRPFNHIVTCHTDEARLGQPKIAQHEIPS